LAIVLKELVGFLKGEELGFGYLRFYGKYKQPPILQVYGKSNGQVSRLIPPQLRLDL